MHASLTRSSILGAAVLGLLLGTSAGAATTQTPEVSFQENREFTPLAEPAPRLAPRARVEVVEVFWYSCPYCNALEPYIAAWRKRLPTGVTFVRVPATWTPDERADARLYYALQRLRRDDLNQAVFAEIHGRKHALHGVTDADSVRLQLEFAKAHGIDPQDFRRAVESAEVAEAVRQADRLVRAYRVLSTPAIVVNGRYTTDDTQAGGREDLIRLIDFLVARETAAANRTSARAP